VMPISNLAQRLIRMGPPDLGFHLDRAPILSVDDGLYWMRDWHDRDGRHTWQGQSDETRRHAIHHWRFIRWLYRDEWRKRGGVDA
jgi:hypothetical protein